MNPKVNTISQIDVIEGKVDGDFNKIRKLLLNNNLQWSFDPLSTRYEDSYCPHSPIIDDLLDKIVDDFYNVTGQRVSVINYWGHVHEKNMSTQPHDHGNCYASGVVYISAPKGSGSIVFRPNIDRLNKDAFLTSFPPERGKYYIFPSYLEHFVTRNASKEMRVSLSFNFIKKE